MPTLTLGQHLDLLAQSGETLVIPTPPGCQALWDCGKAAGLHLGALYVLRAPLRPRTTASYSHQSGDVWVVDHPDDPLRPQRSLLHELAHARRRQAGQAHGVSIDDYCDEEIATQRCARGLALAWGVEHLMTLADVASYGDLMEEQRGTLEAAGLLAGSLRYPVASAAYDAVWELAGRQGWTRDLLEDALYGIADDDRINEHVLDFDRSMLRGRWSLGWGDGSADLGPLALPEREQSAPTLRSALEECARREQRLQNHAREGTHTEEAPRGPTSGRAWPAGLFEPRGEEGGYRYYFGLLRLENDLDLATTLAASQHALLAHPEAYAHASWEVYGDSREPDRPRLYHLHVGYSPEDALQADRPPDAHLWIMALAHHTREPRVEAALQRWLAGWRAAVGVQTESLWMGLYTLAEYAGTAR